MYIDGLPLFFGSVPLFFGGVHQNLFRAEDMDLRKFPGGKGKKDLSTQFYVPSKRPLPVNPVIPLFIPKSTDTLDLKSSDQPSFFRKRINGHEVWAQYAIRERAAREAREYAAYAVRQCVAREQATRGHAALHYAPHAYAALQHAALHSATQLSPESDTKSVGSTESICSDSSSQEKQFKCGDCNASFDYKHVLQNHTRTHTGEKPFKCKYCQKPFSRDHHLKTHLRLHTGEKPYVCTVCKKRFVQVANLRRHERVHLRGAKSEIRPMAKVTPFTFKMELPETLQPPAYYSYPWEKESVPEELWERESVQEEPEDLSMPINRKHKDLTLPINLSKRRLPFKRFDPFHIRSRSFFR